MKNTYVKPEMQVESYATENCYAQKCTNQSGTKYKFTCNAEGGPLYYFSNYPANGPQPTTGSVGTLIGDYHPCGKEHSADTNSGFYWGYVDTKNVNKNTGFPFYYSYKDYNERLDTEELVIVWRGENGNNGHATKNLDINSWTKEVVRS